MAAWYTRREAGSAHSVETYTSGASLPTLPYWRGTAGRAAWPLAVEACNRQRPFEAPPAGVAPACRSAVTRHCRPRRDGLQRGLPR